MMRLFFQDYGWQQGRPLGKGPVKEQEADAMAKSYRVVTDPYHKRYTVEEYRFGKFKTLGYDSYLLDFRYVNPQAQAVWQELPLREEGDKSWSFIRDVDDRVILLEEFLFREGRCQTCRLVSPHGLYLGKHQMKYRTWGDSFDGVVLFDATERRVMEKRYSIGENGEFYEVLEENWAWL